MRSKHTNNSYSSSIAKEYISNSLPLYNVTSEIETQHVWRDGKKTADVAGYKIILAQEGVNPFTVKLEAMPELPPFLTPVNVIQLEAIEIRGKVYFRGTNIEVAK